MNLDLAGLRDPHLNVFYSYGDKSRVCRFRKSKELHNAVAKAIWSSFQNNCVIK